jgi:hypothetical protein
MLCINRATESVSNENDASWYYRSSEFKSIDYPGFTFLFEVRGEDKQTVDRTLHSAGFSTCVVYTEI